MKRTYQLFITLLLLAMLPLTMWGEKLTWQDTDPNGDNYLANSRALVGRNCMINRTFTMVNVGTWDISTNNMLDEDLDNIAEFPAVVTAGVAFTPFVSVRDVSRYYAQNTTAGFCLVFSDLSVISANLISNLEIIFYKDGELVGTKWVTDGQGGGLLGLNLIKIPGSESVCMNVTATAPGDFDEVCLAYGGVNADVGKSMKVKYAFAGQDRRHTITVTNGNTVGYNGMKYDVTATKWIVPVLIPIKTDADKIIDDDPNTNEALTAVAAVGYRGTIQVLAEARGTTGELFEPGSEAGFVMSDIQGLALQAGLWAKFRFLDRDGNEVQTETIDASVLGLHLAEGGDKTNSVVAKVPYSGFKIDFYTILNVDAGTPIVKSAFVRPKASVEHHCDIRSSASTDICSTQTSLQLYANSDLTIEWTIVNNNDNPNVSISPSGLVTGLDDVDGLYIFRATSLCGKGDPADAEHVDENGNCYVDIEVRKGDAYFSPEDCDQVLTEERFALMDAVPVGEGATGALLSISDFKNGEFILDSDRATAATYDAGLGLADDLMIVGVKTKDGSLICDGTQTNDVRIGFDVEFVSSGLGADLLQFFNIRTYDVDVRTYRRVVNESNVLKLDLISGANTQRVKFAVTVPAGTKFDRFALWKSGVLNLSLTAMNIYDIFIDEHPETSACAQMFGCGVEQLSNTKHGTRINANGTKSIEVITAGSTDANLTLMVDDDPNFETYMQHFSTANAGGTTYAVDLGRTLDYRHQIGVVIDNKTYLAGVDVGSWLTIETYYKGVATGEKKNDWKVLGADVIGYGDKNVLLMEPKFKYDEIRITVAGVLKAVDQMKIYGLFIRNDIDNDGVPDCLDDVSCAAAVTGVAYTKACQGQEMTIEGTYTGNTGIPLLLRMPEQFDGVIPFTTGDGGKVVIPNVPATRSGEFVGLFYTADSLEKFVSAFDYRVYPLYSRWRDNTVNADWNEWANWTEGAPYLCTDVTIPTGAAKYPSLNTTTMTDGDEYPCNRIHFEPGAAVEYVHRLNYTQAWVDLEVEANRNYLLSAALKNTYTGDFFVPENDFVAASTRPDSERYFTAITEANTPAKRFEPKIYQRLWDRVDHNKVYSGTSFADQSNAVINATKWSYAFNALAHKYVLGEGFSMLADATWDNDYSGSYMMRFPKTHTEYAYFDDFTQEEAGTSETGLDRSLGYRFVYETDSTKRFDDGKYYTGENARPVYANLPLTVTTTTTQDNMTAFLVGNPLMSHIDVAKFLAGNSNVTGLKSFDGSTVNSAIDINGVMVYSGNEFSRFNPMESFFVETAEGKQATVTFTEEMFGSGRVNSVGLMAPKRANGFGQLRLSATTGGITAGTVLLSGVEGASETLIDEDAAPVVAVFAVFDGRGYDIHRLDDVHEIPLGIYLRKGGNVTLSFNALGDIDLYRFELLDCETGATYSLTESHEFALTGTSIGRFMLVNKAVPTAVNELAGGNRVALSVAGDVATLHSTADDITRVEVLGADGKVLRTVAANSSRQVSVNTVKGVNVIVVYSNDGRPVVFKVLN